MAAGAGAGPSLVLGTAGHIDHGKTALIKALTGTDTDRLREEKERGITIELGFARLDLPSGRSMGVVDVPGHERFVRHMVAGATGIDAVLLVVAADDGVMPQTREHVAIIDLLGVTDGVVAITKKDLADEEMVELVTDEVEELLEGTGIEGAPIVAVSARTGEGLDELLRELDTVAGRVRAGQATLPARLPVDRVFTIAGAGTVVTGTLWNGTVSRDDTLEVLPGGTRARVRGIQVHGEPVSSAHAGQRVALNLAGVEKNDLARGDVLAEPGTLTVTDRFDALVRWLPDSGRALESGESLEVHHGTTHVPGRVLLMDGDSLAPGESGLAQVRLDQPLAPRYGDRFVLRAPGPNQTLGGGEVLDVLPPRRTTLLPSERALLDSLVEHDVGRAAVLFVEARRFPMSEAEVARALGVPEAPVAEALRASDLARLEADTTRYVPAATVDAYVADITDRLLAFHEENPKATGISTKALLDRVDPRLPPRVFDALLRIAAEQDAATVEGGTVRHPDAASAAIEELAALEESVSAELARAGLSPPSPQEIAARLGTEPGLVRKALNLLADKGRAVRVGSDMYFDAAVLGEARERIRTYLVSEGEMLAKEARDLLGTSRKYAVPILEYFDSQGLTVRDGDVRRLRS